MRHPTACLVVPCTAPLRLVEDLERCLDAASDPDVDIVLTVTESHRNPWFNMVAIDDRGELGWSSNRHSGSIGARTRRWYTTSERLRSWPSQRM